jgi:hypothetical protein
MRYIIIIFLVLCSTPAWSATLYVNNSGSPACSDSTLKASNTAGSPWCTIGRAMWGQSTYSTTGTPAQAAQAGDVVIVSPGTYAQTATTNSRSYPVLRPVNSGTSGNPITFKAEYPAITATTEQRTIISHSGSRATSTEAIIGVSGGINHIVFDGFYLDETNLNTRCDEGVIQVWGTGVTVKNFIVDGVDAYADWGCSSDVNHSAVRLDYARDITVENNKFFGFFGAHHNTSGIMVYDSYSLIFQHNEIYDVYTGIHVKGDVGDDEQSDVTIRYNLIHDTSIGVEFGGVQDFYGDNYMYQNLIRDQSSWVTPTAAIVFRSYVTGSPAGVWIVNNTIVDFDVSGRGAIRTLASNPGPITVKNNIISGCTIAVGDEDNSSLDADYTFNRNLYYGFTTFSRMNSTNQTFATWQSTYGEDANSLSTSDPLFVNAAGDNLKLDTGSPALTLGRTINAIHGSTDQTIPAGAYITGNEVIGIDTGESISGGSRINTGATMRIGSGSTRIYPVQ